MSSRSVQRSQIFVRNASGGITGTGTANYVAKFTSAGVIGNSSITDDGSAIVLGTTQTVRMGGASATGRRLDVKQGTATWTFGEDTTFAGYADLWANVTSGTISNTNFVIRADNVSTTELNAPARTSLAVAGNGKFYVYSTYSYIVHQFGVNTNGAGSAMLHAVGSGSTSGTFGFRVDSSTVNNSFCVRDDGKSAFGSTPTSQRLAVYQVDTNGSHLDLVNNLSGGRTYTLNVSSTGGLFSAGCFIVYDATGSAPRLIIDSNGNCGIGQTTFGTSATNTFAISSGTAPSTSPSDCFQVYSNDITAGNAAPHFRTEGGDVIKLFKGAAVADAAGGATVDAEARTAINTLLARLRVTGGNGLIAD